MPPQFGCSCLWVEHNSKYSTLSRCPGAVLKNWPWSQPVSLYFDFQSKKLYHSHSVTVTFIHPKPACPLYNSLLLCLSQRQPFSVPFANLHLISGRLRTKQNWTQIGSKILSQKAETKEYLWFFFQPLVFNHPFFHPTAMLALQCYWYTDIPARKARNGQAAFLSAFLGSTALHSQNVSPFSWGRILWHIRLYNRHTSPFPKPQYQSCLYLMCVWDGFVTIPHCPPIN